MLVIEVSSAQFYDISSVHWIVFTTQSQVSLSHHIFESRTLFDLLKF